MGAKINAVAQGNIGVSCFVKIDTTAATVAHDNSVLQASTNDPIIGIAYEGSRQVPLSDVTNPNYAAIAGEPFRIYGDDDECQVIAGATITAGQRLKSDSSGNAVPIATTGTTIQECGAIARESVLTGELCRVLVNIARILPAVS